jgi:transposase
LKLLDLVRGIGDILEMMKIRISAEEKKRLEQQHGKSRDKYVCDRIKAVLLASEGWGAIQIAQALRLHPGTIDRHLTEYTKEGKLKPENGGSYSKLNEEQSALLESHLERHTYTKVSDICLFVVARFSVCYSIPGMTKWLKHHRFSYKHPKEVPAKADLEKQAVFIESYRSLLGDAPAEEPILFMDASHPTMATKVTCGWIRKGVNKPIAQTASRTRVNVMGAIELSSMKVVNAHPEYVNAETTVMFLSELKTAYPLAPTLHVILDQSGYHKSKLVREYAQDQGIELHYLPPYSPNLNPIERLWKVMNEVVRNNRFFSSAREFREAIEGFFETTLPSMTDALRARINDNFQTLIPAPSG